MIRKDYYNFNGFEHIYLEDSFVLEIQDDPHMIRFSITAVLTEEHPLYYSPSPDEQYCYRDVSIIFKNVRRVRWITKTIIPYKDVTGVIDYGNIDALFLEDDYYHIEGSWGVLEFMSDPPFIEYLE